MIVISGNLVLSGAEAALSLDHPVIGWHNVVTASTIAASDSDPNYPSSNLANPATHLEWRGRAIEQFLLTVTTNYVGEIDYIAVARHNWASAEVPVIVDGFFDGGWNPLTDETMLPDDGPALFRFPAQSLSDIRFRLRPGSGIPRAAVVYVGKLLVLERKIYVGHTPMPQARKSNVATGMSEAGNYLGRIQLGAWRESTIPLSLITPDWYRANMDEFLVVAKTTPFFFAWRPETYPDEVGYAWLMEDPMPMPQDPANLLAFDLKVGGVA